MRKSAMPLRRYLLMLAGAFLLTLCACAPLAQAPTPTSNVSASTQVYSTATAEEATEQATTSPTPAVSTTPPATLGVPNTGATAGIPNTGGTTAAPSTGGNAQQCDSSRYISDVTIPDGTVVAPGQSLVKTWSILNNGNCEWAPQYRLAFVSGTFMGASSVDVGTHVRPGKEVSMTVDLTAPLAAGNYVGSYQLQDVRGRGFGNVFTIVITVSGSAVAPTTVPPTTIPSTTATP